MTESTIFLPPELADMGLMAFADPDFAERLVEALQGLPERTRSMLVAGSVASEASETCEPAE